MLFLSTKVIYLLLDISIICIASMYKDYLQDLLNRAYSSIEWCLNSPPKPHAFASLPLQSLCIHGLQPWVCSVCLSMKVHFHAIATCPHNWKPLNYYSHLLGSLCDFGSIHQVHAVAKVMGDVVYHCAACHGIICSGLNPYI